MILRFYCMKCKDFFNLEYEEINRWSKRKLYQAKATCPGCGFMLSKICSRKEANQIKYEKM